MYKLSHLQIKVNSIEQAIEDFKELGFTVERGGKKSRNAFVWFESGPFIELLEMHRSDAIFGVLFGLIYGKAMNARWQKWCAKGEGMIDFAIEPSDAKRLDINNFSVVREEAKKLKLKPGKIITWSRKNIRGNKVYFSYMPILPKELPFLVSGYNIPQRPKSVIHKNGAYKINHLVVACSKEQYKVFQSIVKYDKSIMLEIGENFKIVEIGMKGIKNLLSPDLLHDAVIVNV